MALQGLDAATFLASTWQRRPLLLRSALPHWHCPLSADELAGLACEGGVEARLALYDPARDDWQLEHGPFVPERFATLPERHWTLLVHGVEQWLPEFGALLQNFRFIPDWRIDDVMVSYAADGGSVGPHFDQYDVFLLQARGRRRWRIGPHCDQRTPLREGLPLRLLREFQHDQEWVLDPGDMLYLPPGIAHYGVAEGDDCMTCSIGFRAPSRHELLSGWCDHILAHQPDANWRDPARTPTRRPGCIAAADLSELHTQLRRLADDPALFADWFGRYASLSRHAHETEAASEDAAAALELIRDSLVRGQTWHRAPHSRWLYFQQDQTLWLFADGHRYICTGYGAHLARAWCDAPLGAPLTPPPADAPDQLTLAAQLLAAGSLELRDEH